MTFVHGLQRAQRAFCVSPVHLQLRMAEGNGQLGLWLTLQSALKQVVTFVITSLLVGGTGSP